MQLNPLGDCAVLVTLGTGNRNASLDTVARLAWALNVAPLDGVTDIVPSFSTITVHYDPAKVAAGGGSGAPWDRIVVWIEAVAKAPLGARGAAAAREVVVPVSYGGAHGPDLPAVAAHARMTVADVIRTHAGARYRVAALGFSPGFPYLLGLPARLATPRKATPRLRVPPGSVGIGGGQSGIYSVETPGGWAIIGRTPLRLFRTENEAEPTLLRAGDTVKFIAVSESEGARFEEAVAAPAPAKIARHAATVEVLKAGALTTVQDLGRTGFQHLGVSVGGAMDQRAARVANLLLGNPPDAPLLEAIGTGPELKFLKNTWIAVTGAEVGGVARLRPLRVEAGQVVSLAQLVRGACVYLAIQGGFDVARVLGGAGTLVRAGLGGLNGRALQVGDRLAARAGGLETRTDWSASAEFSTAPAGEVTVRFVRGLQWAWFAAESRRAFLTTPFRVTPRSDRMGLRLEGVALRLDEAHEMASEGVGFGSVQVPSDGNPIVLMADRQTIGGYPKVGHVISVDLPLLAQARAGDSVRFAEVNVAEAQSLYLKQEQDLAWLAVGLRAKLRLT